MLQEIKSCKVDFAQDTQPLTASGFSCAPPTRIPDGSRMTRYALPGICLFTQGSSMNLKKRRQLRRQAFQSQNCICFYCQLPMWEDAATDFCARFKLSARSAALLRCTAEHLCALQDGGQDTVANVVAACAWCNHRRHAGRHDHAPDAVTYKNRVTKGVAKGKWHPLCGVVPSQLLRKI